MIKTCIIASALAFVITGCSFSTFTPGAVTRTERDSYTITVRDTIIAEDVKNVPGSANDNGVVFPSSRTRQIMRETVAYDSTNERYYPRFLRYGGIEFASMITGAPKPGFGAGLLGVYSLLDSSLIQKVTRQKRSTFFQGHLFRLIPVEYPLHWFNNAPDWTIGTSLYESIAQTDDSSKTLKSAVITPYVRKRFWLRDKKPYLILSPYFGLGTLPSTYVNVGTELTFGSYGGFNLRAYAGIASGFTWKWFNPKEQATPQVTTPYIGLGVSALDFINKPSELYREWKDYAHSAIEVSVIDLTLLYATADYPNVFDTTLFNIPLTGGSIQIATSHFPLHSVLDGKFWVGTSLFNLTAFGYNQFTTSFLPLQVGYRQYLIAEDMTLEPSIELHYYPSQYANCGFKLRLNTFKDMTFGIVGGYATGTTGAFLPRFLYNKGSKISSDINTFYLGITFSPKDRLLTPERVKEMEEWEQ